MLIPIITFQHRKFVIPNDLDAGKLVTLLAELGEREVSERYDSKASCYKYEIQPSAETEITLTFVDSSRVIFPEPPAPAKVAVIENTPPSP